MKWNNVWYMLQEKKKVGKWIHETQKDRALLRDVCGGRSFSLFLSIFEKFRNKQLLKKGDYYFCFTSFVWLSSPPQQGMIAHHVALKRGRLSLMSLMNAQAETVLFPKNLFHSSQLLLSLSLYLRWPLWDRGSLKCQRSPVVIHLTLHLVCHIHFFKVTCPSK